MTEERLAEIKRQLKEMRAAKHMRDLCYSPDDVAFELLFEVNRLRAALREMVASPWPETSTHWFRIKAKDALEHKP